LLWGTCNGMILVADPRKSCTLSVLLSARGGAEFLAPPERFYMLQPMALRLFDDGEHISIPPFDD